LADVQRTATVRAKERLITLRIPKEQFMRMVREFPNIAISIMRELAHRVDTTNNQLREAKADLERLGVH
jgi:CRP/FNR family transcriptional regulator, cyclic AMP receptor protein